MTELFDGVIVGNLFFVRLAYGLTWLTLGGYALSLVLRGRNNPPEE